MSVMMTSLFDWVLKLFLAGVVVLYAGLVMLSYAADGARYRVRFDLEHPLRSIERLAVWLGVNAVTTLLRALKAAANALAEVSADVGEWFIAHRSQKTQAEYRSRVL